MDKPGAPIAPTDKVPEVFIALVRFVLVLVEGLNVATAAEAKLLLTVLLALLTGTMRSARTHAEVRFAHKIHDIITGTAYTEGGRTAHPITISDNDNIRRDYRSNSATG